VDPAFLLRTAAAAASAAGGASALHAGERNIS
jgi:hypothetical protein